MRLTALHRFPIKSCRGEELDTALVEPWGLAGDRRWMLVDEAGEAVTARKHRRMLLLRPQLGEDGGLSVTAQGGPTLTVARPDGSKLLDVTVFGRAPFAAALASDAAHACFSEQLGVGVRLVYAEDPHRRQANESYAGPAVPLAFEDGYPVNLGNEASLAALNDLIAASPAGPTGSGHAPLPMVRFRPNFAVAGAAAWEEDGWRRLRIGEATFRVVKGCDRCAIPTTDHETAERSKEPTATLARHRRWDGATWFGVQLVPENPGVTVRLGDAVDVLDAVEAPDGPLR
jgi:uncharacterized protein